MYSGKTRFVNWFWNVPWGGDVSPVYGPNDLLSVLHWIEIHVPKLFYSSIIPHCTHRMLVDITPVMTKTTVSINTSTNVLSVHFFDTPILARTWAKLRRCILWCVRKVLDLSKICQFWGLILGRWCSEKRIPGREYIAVLRYMLISVRVSADGVGRGICETPIKWKFWNFLVWNRRHHASFRRSSQFRRRSPLACTWWRWTYNRGSPCDLSVPKRFLSPWVQGYPKNLRLKTWRVNFHMLLWETMTIKCKYRMHLPTIHKMWSACLGLLGAPGTFCT